MNTKGGIVVSKKEMTRIWMDGKMIPVTLVEVLPQKILRYKTVEKDGYQAVVIWVNEKETKKEKGCKLSYDTVTEFAIDDNFQSNNEIGKNIDDTFLEDIKTVEVKGISKGKGYQGVMKRFHLQGWPETHGSKFHRHVGSMGNRKPRRTMKNHPHAGHMGSENVTIKNVSIIDRIKHDDKNVLVVKGSLPGWRNSNLKFIIE